MIVELPRRRGEPRRRLLSPRGQVLVTIAVCVLVYWLGQAFA